MDQVGRIQEQLRRSAHEVYVALPVPPFTVFVNPDNASPYANYAIPDAPAGGDLAAPLAALRAAFVERGRRPRFEYIEAYAPRLAAALQAAGFVEESATQLMICTPATLDVPAGVDDVSVVLLERDAPLDAVAAALTAQRRGFGDEHEPAATAAEAAQHLRRFGRHQLYVARIGSETVAAGALLSPDAELSEIAGIATLPDYRRRGIAGMLTAHIVRAAFGRGVDLVFLTAADARAGRVYERAGFRPAGRALAYIAA